MHNVVDRLAASKEAAGAEAPPLDQRRQFAFEYELVREQGRPNDY